MDWKGVASRWGPILLMLGMAVAPYVHTFSADFIWDDDFLIRDNPHIRSLGKADELFSLSYWINENPGTPGQYRPLRSLIFALEYALWGTNPLGYRLTNMGVYLLCVYMVYKLAILLFANRVTAVLAGVLFALHPAHTEVTAWVKNLTELLACFFVLSGLWGYALWEKKRRVWAYLLSVMVFPLALVGKETAVSYPLLLGAWVLHRRRRAEWFDALKGHAPHWTVLLVYLVFLFGVLGKRVDKIPGPELTFFQHLYVVLWTAWIYLRDLFFPLYLNAEHLIPMPASAADPVPWVSAASLVAMGLFWYRSRRVHVPSALAVAWTLIALLPVLNIHYITGRPLADQRVFIASVGSCWLLGHWMQRLVHGSYPGIPELQFRVGAWALVVMIMISAGLVTFHRNYVWTDPMLLYADTIKKSPKAERAHYNLGNTYKSREEWDKAIQAFKRAIQIQPNFVGSHNNLGLVYAKIGDLENAEKEYLIALRIHPRSIPTLMNLGNLYIRMGRLNLAQEQFQRVLTINPEVSDAYLHLGDIMAAQGRWQEAESAYRRALALDPQSQEARTQLAETRRMLKEQAEVSLKEVDLVLEQDPKDYEGWVTRGNILAQQGQTSEALAAYDRAIRIDPADFRAYIQRGLALEVVGDLEGAKREYRRAISLDSGSGVGHMRMGSVLLHQGNIEEAEAHLEMALKDLPEEPEAHLIMARLCLERDDKVKRALKHLEQVARMVPHHPQIDEIRRVIQFLREADPESSGRGSTR